MAKKFTTEDFISRSNMLHNNFFDYSLTEYINKRSKVKIVCPIHGLFEQVAGEHMRGRGCLRCRFDSHPKRIKHTFQSFLIRAIAVHGSEKYKYSEESYNGQRELVNIYCNDCKEWFSQKAYAHTNKKQGCPHCSIARMSKTKTRTFNSFVLLASKMHNNKYIYFNKHNYTNNKSKIKVFCLCCNKSFTQVAVDHTRGAGCYCQTIYGYNPSKQGILYILQDGDITKIGITNRTAQQRCNDINKSSGKDFKVIYQLKCNNGAIPQRIEKNVLNYLRRNYQNLEETFDGSTECFISPNINEIMLHVRYEHLQSLKENSHGCY